MNSPRRTLEALILLLLLATPVVRALDIIPFDHEYRIYRGETPIAKARMRLYSENDYWIWSLTSEPVGWLRLLTHKRPFTETWLRTRNGEPQLILTRSGDHVDKPAERSTWFDDQRNRLYYAKGNTTRQLDFEQPPLDVLSIHLLYPRLLAVPDHRIEIPFYKKGRIKRSQLVLEPGVELRSGDRTLILDRITQTLEDSDRRMVYYYLPGDIAPVKIEQYKGKTMKTVMWRQDVK